MRWKAFALSYQYKLEFLYLGRRKAQIWTETYENSTKISQKWGFLHEHTQLFCSNLAAHGQIWSKNSSRARKRCAGGGFCPKGSKFTRIFALALTVLEISAKN